MTSWVLTRIKLWVLIAFTASACNSNLQVNTKAVAPTENPSVEFPADDSASQGELETKSPETVGRDITGAASKLADPDCLDPDLSKVQVGVAITLCDGTVAEGTLVIPAMPAACVADGESDCVISGPEYKAAKLTNFSATDIRSGIVVAGVSGSFIGSSAVCTNDGDGNCLVDGSSFKAAKLSNFSAADLKSGVTIAGVGGSATIEFHSNCAADGGTGCVATGTYTAALTTGLAAKVVSGNTVAGVPGTATAESHSNCAADGGTGCVATGTYTAALTTGLAAKVVSGNTVAGVPGTATAESHSSCAADGEAGCVVIAPAFKAADTSVAVAGNIKSGVTLAGTLGTYGSACSADGGGSCLVDGTTYKAAKLSNFTGADVKSGVTIAGVGGSASLESHSNCAADGGTGCVATGTYTAALTTGLAAKVVSGNTVAGVSGTATAESHSNCAADGGTGCVATGTYTAALTTGLAAKVVSGNTVAGVPGTATAESHSSCSAANQSGCVATTTYKTMDLATAGAGTGLTNANFNTTIKTAGNFEFWDTAGAKHTVAGDTDLAAANIASTINIFGTNGTATLESHGSCTADNQTGCITTATYKSADTTAIATSDLKSGKTIAGIAGALANCSAGGDAGCVVVGPAFKAADMSVVTAGNIKAGVSIAGVAGDYPSATNRLPGASGTTDLTSMAATVAAGSYEFWDSAGARYTGTITDASTITPGTSDQIFNASLYRQFTVSGDADLVAAKIKNGVVLFGVSGSYPSAVNPLTGADATADLDVATFDAKIKSASSFEWFDAYGNRYTNTGDADITSANIISGVTIFGASGSAAAGSNCTGDGQIGCVTTSQYKSADTNTYSTWDIRKGKTVGGKAGDIVFYKNMIGSYNNSTAPAVAGNDVWDTVEDANGGGAFPTTAPSGWDQATGANWIMDPANDIGGGGGTASDNLCSGSEACVFKDQITGLMWNKDDGTTRTWQNSITYCDGLSYGGYTDWRLPTQKELMQAYTDGIGSQKATNKLNLAITYYWTATTNTSNTSYAWIMYPNYGDMYYDSKTLNLHVVCVR